MKTAITFAGAFVIYYVGLFVAGITAFLVLALLVRWVCPCRNCRHRRRRGRSTRSTPQHATVRDGTGPERVGRPDHVIVIDGLFATGDPRPFDVAWRENWNSWGELAGNLADGGRALLEEEQLRGEHHGS